MDPIKGNFCQLWSMQRYPSLNNIISPSASCVFQLNVVTYNTFKAQFTRGVVSSAQSLRSTFILLCKPAIFW